MSSTATQTPATVFTSLGMEPSTAWTGHATASFVVAGREYSILSTPSRSYLTIHPTVRGGTDGSEVARRYGAPEVTVPALLEMAS